MDPTSSVHLFALKATPCTSVFEESLFGPLSDQWKLMGLLAAPWRVSATAISRADAIVGMPILEEDVSQVVHRAARVEEMHRKCVKNFRIQPAKRKQDDILLTTGSKAERKSQTCQSTSRGGTCAHLGHS